MFFLIALLVDQLKFHILYSNLFVLALFYLIIVEIIIELNCNLINCENCLRVIAVCIFDLSVFKP